MRKRFRFKMFLERNAFFILSVTAVIAIFTMIIVTAIFGGK